MASLESEGVACSIVELTDEQRQYIDDREELDDTTCPADIERFKNLIINAHLGRAHTRLWTHMHQEDLHRNNWIWRSQI